VVFHLRSNRQRLTAHRVEPESFFQVRVASCLSECAVTSVASRSITPAVLVGAPTMLHTPYRAAHRGVGLQQRQNSLLSWVSAADKIACSGSPLASHRMLYFDRRDLHPPNVD
jgi:hypothetical protein